jgi:hypothetical protein
MSRIGIRRAPRRVLLPRAAHPHLAVPDDPISLMSSVSVTQPRSGVTPIEGSYLFCPTQRAIFVAKFFLLLGVRCRLTLTSFPAAWLPKRLASGDEFPMSSACSRLIHPSARKKSSRKFTDTSWRYWTGARPNAATEVCACYLLAPDQHALCVTSIIGGRRSESTRAGGKSGLLSCYGSPAHPSVSPL